MRLSIDLIQADVLDGLKSLPPNSVHCVVTSPPYQGLRDYGVEGQIGQESTLEQFITRLVYVFREVRRVLHPSGTIWVNMGDSYNGTRTRGSYGDQSTKGYEPHGVIRAKSLPGLHSKNLVGQPWRVAFALQSDGWILRDAIVWEKGNPMPSSVIDRPTSCYEMLFLLSKSPRYYYDATAVRTDTHNLWNVWNIPTEPVREAHFACVDTETECLTKDGWKHYNELSPGMIAAQFDISSGVLSWASIEDVAIYSVIDQPMVSIAQRDLSMLLTPNHRTVVKHYRDQENWSIVEAAQLKPSYVIPTSADWESASGKCPISVEMAELLGWYIAEGHENKQSNTVEIYQSPSANPQKVLRIHTLLAKVSAEYQFTSRTREQGRSIGCWRIRGFINEQLRSLAPKKLLAWSVLDWDTTLLYALLDGLIGGDGHTRQDDLRRSFIQKNQHTADLVQAICVRLGYATKLSKHNNCQTSTLYLTNKRSISLRGTNANGGTIQTALYTGFVWCPKLPHGTWVARRNGRTFITGNTYPQRLVEPCVLAGTSQYGCCSQCLNPWKRVEIKDGTSYQEKWKSVRKRADCPGQETSPSSVFRTGTIVGKRTIGWQPTCKCDASTIPCTVLDPFIGSGTTAMVANRLGRQAIGIEINGKYINMAEARIRRSLTQPLFTRIGRTIVGATSDSVDLVSAQSHAG